MTGVTKPSSIADIADRLGKLIPRLASNYGGEVIATVNAIGRTLQGVGCDWYDLAARLTAPTLDDLLASPPSRPRPAPEPQNPSEPQKPSWCSDADWARTQRGGPKKQPPAWPIWGRLSHFGHLEMFDEILKHVDLKPDERARLVAAHAEYYRHQNPPSRKDTNLFNAACRALWGRGAQSGETAA